MNVVDSQAARSQFYLMVNDNPYAVRACNGQTAEMARKILMEAIGMPALEFC